MRIRASSLGSTSGNRSKKEPSMVEKLASVPLLATSSLCSELYGRSHHAEGGWVVVVGSRRMRAWRGVRF
jgi:hypothetical protein